MDQTLFNELKEAFSLFDSDQKGIISSRSLKALLRVFGVKMSKLELKKVFQDELKKTYGEDLNFDEFAGIIVARLPERDSKEHLERVFKLFDEDGKGGISFNDLKKIARDIGIKIIIKEIISIIIFKGEKINDEDLYNILGEADRDMDGLLNFDEFYR